VAAAGVHGGRQDTIWSIVAVLGGLLGCGVPGDINDLGRSSPMPTDLDVQPIQPEPALSDTAAFA